MCGNGEKGKGKEDEQKRIREELDRRENKGLIAEVSVAQGEGDLLDLMRKHVAINQKVCCRSLSDFLNEALGLIYYHVF